MTYSTKVQGTRYVLELTPNLDADDYKLALTINGVDEEALDISNLSLRSIQEGVEDLIGRTNISLNTFQLELMAKDLYKESTGDINLEEHKKGMEEIQKKQKMVEDGSFQQSIVSEYKSSLGVKEGAPKKQPKVNKKEEKVPEKQQKIVQEAQQQPDMKKMMSEMSKRVDPTGQRSTPQSTPQRSGTSSTPNHGLKDPSTNVDTRVTAVDIEDLISELNETKTLLRQDIQKVNQRMDKIENIIAKISSISNKL